MFRGLPLKARERYYVKMFRGALHYRLNMHMCLVVNNIPRLIRPPERKIRLKSPAEPSILPEGVSTFDASVLYLNIIVNSLEAI